MVLYAPKHISRKGTEAIGTVIVVDLKENRKVLATLLKVVEMVGNSVSHPKDKTLSLADGHMNAT